MTISQTVLFRSLKTFQHAHKNREAILNMHECHEFNLIIGLGAIV